VVQLLLIVTPARVVTPDGVNSRPGRKHSRRSPGVIVAKK
jgi:hypothetical protein